MTTVPTNPDSKFNGHPTRTATVLRTALLVSLATLTGCSDTEHAAPVHAPHAASVDFATSCDPAVRDDFNHAVTLLHHMTYPQARSAFRAIATRDPACAMADWGVAMTLFQPLWPTRPSAEDLHAGWAAVRNAQASARTTPREKAFIAATAAFFEDPDNTDYWQRIARWQTAMATAHAAFPDDAEVSAFHALALLATGRSGPAMQEHAREAEAVLTAVLRDHPDHPGAMHYIIHANDVAGREHEDLDVVHEYETLAPDNPHALHMPTHIYTRLGDWDGVVRGNLRAADAALKFPAGEHGEWVWDEFAHAIEYLVYAYLQLGEDERASEQIARLLATPNIEPTSKTAFHLASTRARYALERQDWNAAAALVPGEPAVVDWARFPWPDAVVWFAHGLGALRTGHADESRAAIARLAALDAKATAAGEDSFARQIRILRLELEAWNAHTARDDATSVAKMHEAVDLETSTPKPPVTPAPTLPATEQLGELYAAIGRPSEALAAYRAALQAYPRRYNATLGAARARAASNDTAGAAEDYCALLRIAGNGSRASLAEARRHVAEHSPVNGNAALRCEVEQSLSK